MNNNNTTKPPPHLCIHCRFQSSNPYKINNDCDHPLIDDAWMTSNVQNCNLYEQKLYPYCPTCGHVFTIAEQILDENENYLEDGKEPLGYTCIECGSITII